MTYIEWHPGIAINSPVYLDANVFVGILVRRHRLYPVCARLAGELLASGCHILVSPIAIQECLWALVRLSYCELFGHPPWVYFSQDIYKRWCGKIFSAHGGRITKLNRMLRDWSTAGLNIELVPKTESVWNDVADKTPKYMRDFAMAPADALHLALAEAHAQTFITADEDFHKPAESIATSGLVILHLTPLRSI